MPVPVPEPWSLEEPDFDEIEIGSAAKGSAESVSAATRIKSQLSGASMSIFEQYLPKVVETRRRGLPTWMEVLPCPNLSV